jgi:hypothetical protein
MFAELWKQATDDGAYVFYRGAISERDKGLEGAFYPPDREMGTPPWVCIFPETGRDMPTRHDEPMTEGPSVLRDLIILAHEYGHFRSWVDACKGTTEAWQAYFRAATILHTTDIELSAVQARLVIDEEQRAWNLGAAILGALGFVEWQAFESCRDRSLRAYRVMTGPENGSRPLPSGLKD